MAASPAGEPDRAAGEPRVEPAPQARHGAAAVSASSSEQAVPGQAGSLSGDLAPAASPAGPTHGAGVTKEDRATLGVVAKEQFDQSLTDFHERDRLTEVDHHFETLLKRARDQRKAGLFVMANQTLERLLRSQPPKAIQKSALLELTAVAQQDHRLVRAAEILNQLMGLFPHDPQVPEILLRQGLLYRQIGSTQLALTKFYAVMTVSLNLGGKHLEDYQRTVLQAQIEIANTHYVRGRYDLAAGFYRRILKLKSPYLERENVYLRLIRSIEGTGRLEDIVTECRRFIESYPGSDNRMEIRFDLAVALQRLGQNQDALEQVLAILAGNQAQVQRDPERWSYWQQRAGNEIGNRLYESGDYQGALKVYLALEALDTAPEWQIPVWYQLGLVYERLQQPDKARETYQRIIGRATQLEPSQTTVDLKTVLEMAQWRDQFLQWQRENHAAIQPLLPGAPPRKKTAQPVPNS